MINMFVGRRVLPKDLKLPTTEIVYGERERATVTRADGFVIVPRYARGRDAFDAHTLVGLDQPRDARRECLCSSSLRLHLLLAVLL